MTYPYGKRKKCEWCDRLFKPKPNNANRQLYCNYPQRPCKMEAKQHYDQSWRKAHPGYPIEKSKLFRKKPKEKSNEPA